jgi:sortase B
MLMMLPTRTVLIEVMAGYVTSLDDPCYEIAISDSDDMREYVERAMSKSNFLSDVTVGDADHLVTLSTCAYAFEQARYVLIGKLTTAWEAEPVPVASEQPLP